MISLPWIALSLVTKLVTVCPVLPSIAQPIGDRIGDEFRIANRPLILQASYHAGSIFDYLTIRSQDHLPNMCGLMSTGLVPCGNNTRVHALASGRNYGEAADGEGGGKASFSMTYPIVL